ncbi:thioesterase family protein [soil metagenome]
MKSGVAFDPASLPLPTATLPTRGVIHVRVRYCECDPMGVAHHAVYPIWFEIARTELLRAGGVTYAQLESAGIFLVIARIECRYKRPARYDDHLEIRAAVTKATRVKIEHAYEVWRPHATLGLELCTEATSTLACVDGAGHPRALPEWMTAKH